MQESRRQRAKRLLRGLGICTQNLIAVVLGLWVILPSSYAIIETPCWTLNHPGEGYRERIAAAQKIVARERPGWYKEDLRIGVDLHRDRAKFLGITRRTDKGDLVFHLCQSTLDLCTAEDVSHVLLHELVHVKLWKPLKVTTPSLLCREIRHELLANAETIIAYDDLGYSPQLLLGAVQLYRKYYLRATLFCPREVWEILPVPLELE